MRIGHCQLDSQLGDFAGNLKKMVQGLERADRERVEIVCFPECFLTGYTDDAATARRDAFTIDSPQIMQVPGGALGVPETKNPSPLQVNTGIEIKTGLNKSY